MYEVTFLFVLAGIYTLIASIQDLKKREVDDWLSFSLIIFALGFRFFYCLFENGSFSFFYQGLIGLGMFFVIGNLLYYSHFFAGGDAKLMIALGTILPIYDSFRNNLYIFMIFFLIFLFAGLFYTLFFSIFLAVKNKNEFKKEFASSIRKDRKIAYLGLVIGLIFIAGGFVLDSILFYPGILFVILPYIYVFSKSIEKVSMIKRIDAKNLQEGDWLYKDVKVGKKNIIVKWDGLSKEEIKLLRKYKKKVLIKQGIPFVPVFFISFWVLIWWIFYK